MPNNQNNKAKKTAGNNQWSNQNQQNQQNQQNKQNQRAENRNCPTSEVE